MDRGVGSLKGRNTLSTKARWGILLLLALAQALYTPINRFVSGGAALALPLDSAVPLAPGWVYPYLMGILWWFATLVWACFGFRSHLLFRFSAALLFSHLVAYSLYLVLPTYALRPEVVGDGLAADLVRWVYSNDRAYNAFPSGHTYMSLVVLLAWWEAAPRTRWVVTPFAAAVILSTLFTRQHHFADVAGGLVLGWIAWKVGGRAASWWEGRAQAVGSRGGLPASRSIL